MKTISIVFILIVVVIGLVLLFTGCGSKEDTDSQEGPPPASSNNEQPPTTSPTEPPTDLPMASNSSPQAPATDAESSPQSTEENQPSIPATDASSPESRPQNFDADVRFSGSIQALKELTSYRYTTVMKYTDTTASGTESETTTIVGEYVAPDSYHLTIQDTTEGEKNEFIKISEGLWVYDDGDWMQVPDNAASAIAQTIFGVALDFVWSTLASNLAEGTFYKGKETVNGIEALHYSSTSSYWQEMVGESYGQGQGDIWIAEEGYPVRFMFSASGTDEQGNSGSIEWTGNVTKVNSEITISPPITN